MVVTNVVRILAPEHTLVRAVFFALVFITNTLAVLGVPGVGPFSPSQGEPGTGVTINGSGFSTATVVTFNGAIAVFQVISDTQIHATVPADAITGPIGVTASSGTGSSIAHFSVAPRITSISPGRGGIGAVITINGANFVLDATTVKFNGVTASANVTSTTQLSATVPSGATNGFITITTAAGTVVSLSQFVVSSAPFIESFSPGVAAPGTPVAINGANFLNANVVTFNGVSSSFTVVSPSQINATVPATAMTGPVAITANGQTGTSTNNFITGPGPIITNFSPAVASVGQQVIISGVNFLNATAVRFHNTVNASFTVTADSQIMATVPAGAQTGLITVVKNSIPGQSSTNIVITSQPVVSGFNPHSGESGNPNVNINIQGFNFVQNLTQVRFNGVEASEFVTANNLVIATVPAGATTGPISVYNSNTPGISNVSVTNFVVTGPGPSITSFSPSGGPSRQIVQIDGLNFSTAFSVKFNGQPAEFNRVAGTQISAIVPADAETGPISITTPSGTTTSTNSFFVWPRIQGFSPTNGAAGASIVITGANFTGASFVKFAGVPAPFTVNSNASITATVPAGPGNGALTVITPAGIVTSISEFHILPKIDNLSVIAAQEGGAVTIFGSGFFNVTSVRFNNLTASFAVQSSALITTTVPAGATSGLVTVTTVEGTAESTVVFTVLPTIQDFNPKSGGVGTEVIITGKTFGAVTNVLFNGVTSTFSVDSANQITATVPANSGTGPITLHVPGGATTSAGSFQFVPLLGIAKLPGDLFEISWPAVASNFVLQTATNLNLPISWTTATNQLGTNGNQIRTTNANNVPERYFRLQLPPPE